MRGLDPHNIAVSIILTGHREGRLIHRTVRSAEIAADYARERGIATEIIAVLDSPDEETTNYFESRRDVFSIVEEIEVRDPGVSRNRGVELAHGKYVCFLDGDDLFSQNWVEAAYRFATSYPDEQLVLHPDLNLCFGTHLAVFPHVDSRSEGFYGLNLLQFNLWSALCFVSREFFRDGNQYLSTDLSSGFGHEDWHWNCETSVNGAVHRTVPGTVHFLRRKPAGSRSAGAEEAGFVIRPSAFFNDQNLARMQATAPNEETHKEQIRNIQKRNQVKLTTRISSKVITLLYMMHRWARLTYRKGRSVLGLKAKGLPKLSACLHDIIHSFRHFLVIPYTPPDWLVEEWRAIHRVEPELFPSEQALKDVFLTMSVIGLTQPSATAKCYPTLSKDFGPSATHVLLLPGDKGDDARSRARSNIETILATSPESRVVCLVTDSVDESWKTVLPNDVNILQCEEYLGGCLENEKDYILLRLLLQKQPAVIHNVASTTAYRLFCSYKTVLASQSDLYATVLTEDASTTDGVVSPVTSAISKCFPKLTRIFAEDKQCVDRLKSLYWFDESKFIVINESIPATAGSPHSSVDRPHYLRDDVRKGHAVDTDDEESSSNDSSNRMHVV